MTGGKGLRKYFIADRPFYREVLQLAAPMAVQNAISNVVSLLDNVMVGSVGTMQMSAVAIVNQLMLIFYLCIFGATAGAGIYGAQFFGKGDHEGVRVAMRYKLVLTVAFAALATAVFIFFGEPLIKLYLSDSTSAAEAAETLSYAKDYLHIMLIGTMPFAVTQCYASMLREVSHTKPPMVASITAMAVNFVFNGLLIFGLFGFPKLGVVGAAIATVLSRFVEAVIVIFAAHRGKTCRVYFEHLYSHFRIPRKLAGDMTKKAVPLVANEFGWSIAQAAILQTYSLRGLGVVAALNIANTISMVFIQFFFSLGGAASIMVGQRLGADDLDDAKFTAFRMLALSLEVSVIIGLFLCGLAPFIPQIYNTTDEIRTIAMWMLIILGMFSPVNGMANSLYFTLRSGGKAFITFIFDSGFNLVITLVVVNLLIKLTDLPILPVYAIANALEILKCIIGFIILKSGIWAHNLVKNAEVQEV
ncbi:MAG: MATE family efflux transporter [Lachnospiraceae bacterium]|nr:MATE family efflux transporter [Lachnospiraceae bacterium]